MPVKFIVDHPMVRAIELNNGQLLDKLPAQVYTVAFNPMMGFSLTINKDILQLPTVIYGNADKRTEQCLASYRDRNSSTGILLTGDKGTGKTLQMALLANKVITDLELPVILVKEPFAGSQFTSFLESLGECCLVFDEFGKMYKAKKGADDSDTVSQNALLSLMDGVDKTKRLIILTENDKWDINEFMLNRPSRIYYHFQYSKLAEDSINGYCHDKSVAETITKDIIDLSRKSEIFSFDILQSIVEEHLRFGSSVEDVVKDLNIDVKEKDLKIQVMKIIDRKSNKELVINGSPIISYNGYDFSISAEYSKEQQEQRKQAMGEVAININRAPGATLTSSFGIYMEETSLAYRSGIDSIYENDDYTIVTKEVITQTNNYSALL